MFTRVLLGFTITAVLAGCTYMEQKADLKSGGPARREAEAQTRQKEAIEKQKVLFDQRQSAESDAKSAQEELDAAEQQLAEVSRDLESISAEIEAARRRNAISDAEYKRLKSEAGKANMQAAFAQMDSGAGGSGAAQKKKQQIEALKKKKVELEKALSMSTRP